MTGDKVKALTTAWYQPGSDISKNTQLLEALLTTLVNNMVPGIVGAAKGGNGTQASNGNTQNEVANFLSPQQNAVDNDRPRAYLNWILLDEEQFKRVEGGEGFVQVPLITGAMQKQVMQANSGNYIEIKKNGFLYVYISNESKCNVYFDDIRIEHTQGPLLEESHYYPFGLKIAALSSKAFDAPNNPYQYQGDYSEFDDETGWNDFELRTYDAQIGRFIQQDPYSQFPSPYTGMGNDPVNTIDPSGGLGIDFGTIGQITGSVLADRALITLAGAGIGYGIDKLTGGNGWTGAAIGGGVVLGATFIPPFDISAVTNWTKEWLPGLVAAPVSGTLNALGSAVGTIGGITRGDKSATRTQLGNIGKGLLETVGLREALTEKWKPGATGGRLPNSLSDIMDDVNTKVWSGYVDAPAKNGMHSWHAGTNAALAQRLGPVGSLFVFLGGIYHETPFDKGSFKAEQAAQGTVNHILDSFSDIISNGIGIGIGMILPKRAARNVAIKFGNQIPGPGDPDPHGVGTGGYTGNPFDAWGQYPKFK